MVGKCANPGCERRFLHSGEGKLFLLDRRSGGSIIENVFWLCGQCAATHSVVLDKFSQPTLVARAENGISGKHASRALGEVEP